MPTAFRKGRSLRAQDAPPGPAPEGVVLEQGPPAAGTQVRFADDDEEFLFGPTTRPDEPVTAGATVRRAPPPSGIDAWLPVLLEAAAKPGAPPELHAFIRRLRSLAGA